MNRREFVVAAAALAIAPDAIAASLGGGTPVALVTADLESRIVALELPAGRRLRTIESLPGPRSIERVGSTSVVAHTAHGAVAIGDAALNVQHVLQSFEQPRYTAASPASPDGRHAFVTDSGAEAIAVVDVLRGRVVRRLAVGGPARHISAALCGHTTTSAAGCCGPRESRRVVQRGERLRRGLHALAEPGDALPRGSQGPLCLADRRGRVTRSVRVARSSHDACFVTAA